MSICILTHNQVKQWQISGQRPPCIHHIHVSYTKAMRQVTEDNAIFIPELRAIVIYDCVNRYVWRGCKSDGFSVMQLVPVTGVHGN